MDSGIAALAAKVRGLVEGILSPGETDALIDLCWSLESLPDAGELARHSVPAAR